MKLFSFIFVFACISSLSYSQENNRTDDDKIHTLLEGGKIKTGFFIGLEPKFSTYKGDFAFLIGGRTGVIINDVFSVGLAGYGLTTNHKTFTTPFDTLRKTDTSYYLRMGYGGLMLEYLFMPKNVAHFNIHCLVGAGGAVNTVSFHDMMNNEYNTNRNWYNNGSAFFVLEPGITGEINITNYFRIAAGVSYRWVTGLELTNVTNKDLCGISGNLIFVLGKFR